MIFSLICEVKGSGYWGRIIAFLLLLNVVWHSPAVGQAADTLSAFKAFSRESEILEIERILAYDPAYPLLLFQRRDSIFLAKKDGWAWVSWGLKERGGPLSTSYRLERKDVTGDGSGEILLWWEHRYGHSGWNGGNINVEKGVEVWLFSAPVCVLDLTYTQTTEIWWQEYEEALEETEEYDTLSLTDSGSEAYGYSYRVEFLENGFLRLDSLELLGEGEEEPDVEMGSYRFEEVCFRKARD